MAPMKATDSELIAAYAELDNVHKVGERLGMSGSSVHIRLTRLGVMQPMNVFTDGEKERLRADYAAFRASGKVADLAYEMGRTVQFLSRQARALGLTDAGHQKVWFGKWKYMSDQAARLLMDDLKASSLGLGQYCAKNGYDDDGMRRALCDRWPDEWEAVMESKVPAQTMYRLGRALEYRVRDRLTGLGYFAMRSPASKSPIDIMAVRPGTVLMIQCKRGGTLPPAGWNALYDLALSCGAVPVMAEMPYPRRMDFWLLTGRKDGSKRRQPMVPFDPADIEAAS